MTDPARRGDNSIWLNGRPVDPAEAIGAGAGAPRGRSAPLAQTQRVMSLAVLVVPVVLGVVIGVSQEPDATLATLPVVASVVAAAAALGAILAIGYTIPPLEAGQAGDRAERLALQRSQTAFFLRFACAEAPALIAVALTFATDPISVVNYLPGGVLALVLLAWHVVPNRWNVGRAQAALDRNGGRSQLLAQFGY